VPGVRLTASEPDAVPRAAARLRAGRYGRRRFLGVAGALAGALLAACGRDAARARPPSDAEVFGELLSWEQRARAAVRGVPGGTTILRQDREHAARLSAVAGIAALAPHSHPSGDLRAALARKQEGVFAYVDALPRLSDPALRVLVMQLAASEAGHLAALRLAAGEEPVPDPFAGLTEEPAR
jgi:Ferritin-like domain